MQLILDTRGIVVRQRNGCFHLKTEKYERLIGVQKVSSVLITTHCVLTTAAIRLAVQHSIPIYFLDGFGRVEARLWSPSFGRLSTLRRQQVLFATALPASRWVIGLFELKIKQQTRLLSWLANRKPGRNELIAATTLAMEQQGAKLKTLSHELLAEVGPSLLGIEGVAARYYWEELAECLPVEYRFEDRNRQPARDAFNAAINYIYGMLYTYVETALFSVGLDPYLGILHADQYDKPTLSYDLIEPFRPWADRVVVEAILSGEVALDFFDQKDGAVLLGKKGKQFFIPRFNTYMAQIGEFENQKTSRKNHINRFAGQLVEILLDFR